MGWSVRNAGQKSANPPSWSRTEGFSSASRIASTDLKGHAFVDLTWPTFCEVV